MFNDNQVPTRWTEALSDRETTSRPDLQESEMMDTGIFLSCQENNPENSISDYATTDSEISSPTSRYDTSNQMTGVDLAVESSTRMLI